MIATAGKILQAYYDLLNGQLSYASTDVAVYKIDAPETTDYHYVILRIEGESAAGNKSKFADDTVIIIDIVTMFNNNINGDVVEEIDDQIGAILLTAPQTSGLTDPAEVQILNVTRETTVYLPEDDGKKKYYRKVSRYKQRVHITDLSIS